MRIREDNDEEIIHLPGFWSSIAKLAFALSIPATAAEVSKAGLAADVTKTQIEATKSVKLLKAAPIE